VLFPFRAEILWLASSSDELVVAPFNVPNGGLLKVVEVNNLTNALPREEAADDGRANPLLRSWWQISHLCCALVKDDAIGYNCVQFLN
jgi:hypothetical protein